jgi:hypothetical protein
VHFKKETIQKIPMNCYPKIFLLFLLSFLSVQFVNAQSSWSISAEAGFGLQLNKVWIDKTDATLFQPSIESVENVKRAFTSGNLSIGIDYSLSKNESIGLKFAIERWHYANFHDEIILFSYPVFLSTETAIPFFRKKTNLVILDFDLGYNIPALFNSNIQSTYALNLGLSWRRNNSKAFHFLIQPEMQLRGYKISGIIDGAPYHHFSNPLFIGIKAKLEFGLKQKSQNPH